MEHKDITGLSLHEPFHYTQTSDPGAVGADKYWLDTTTSPYVLKRRNAGNSAWVTVGSTGGGGGGSSVYPQDAHSFYNTFVITAGGGTMTLAKDNNQNHGFMYYIAPGAVGDTAQTTVVLEAGTYDVYILGCVYNDRGIVKWKMDGTDFITGQDWYGSLLYNAIKTGTVTVGASGRHILSLETTGKNASSSGYIVTITAVWFVAQTQSQAT